MIRMPFEYNLFHNIGRLAAAYVRGARNLDGTKWSLSDVVVSFFEAINDSIIPPGLSQSIPLVPTLALPFAEVMANRNYFDRPINPEALPGDKRPDSQLAFPGVSPISREIAEMLNKLTGGDAFEPGLIDISPGTISHVFMTYGGAATSLVFRTISEADKRIGEALGINVEDPDLSAGDLPFLRKVIGRASPYQAQDATYRRIARMEILAARLKAATEGKPRDPEEARRLRQTNGFLIPLIPDARKLRRDLADMRKEQMAIKANDKLSLADKRKRIDAIEARRNAAMRAFNIRYMAAQRRQEKANVENSPLNR
jgi:hypothetical protein